MTLSLDGLRAQQHEAFVKEIQGALADLGDVPVPDGLPELARAVRRLVRVAEAARTVAALEPGYSEHDEIVDEAGVPCPPCVEWLDAMHELEAALATVSVGLRGERDTTKEAE